MSIRLSALAERLQTSLFFVPLVLVIIGGAGGVAMTALDAAFGDDAGSLPFVLTSTVDSARDVLGVVAAATISFAGIAFSVSLLVIQQASSQFSPRVVHALFRNPFNRRVMGLAVGTFAYCLMVLRAVRGSLEEGGEPVIPNLSIAVAVVLGILAILAIVAFIDHNAHSLEISQILSRVAADTVAQIERNFGDDDARAGSAHLPAGEGHPVLLTESGWIQQIDHRGLLPLVPEASRLGLPHSLFVGDWKEKGWTSGIGVAVADRSPRGATASRRRRRRSRDSPLAAIEGPRGPLQVFVAMLDYPLDGSARRQAQVRQLCEFVANTASRRYVAVVCGDFNAAPDSDEIRMLTGRAEGPVPGLVFYDAWEVAGDGSAGITWSNKNPLAAIGRYPDRRFGYIFTAWPRAGAAGHPTHCQLLGVAPEDGAQISDHYGVLADLRY